jgi:hypothetical protein
VIETRAYVTWDDTPEMIVRAHPLRVRSSAALPIVDPHLPFSVLDAAAGPSNAGQRQLTTGATAYLELPPAVPVRSNGAPPSALEGAEQARLGPAVDEALPAVTALVLDLTPERLDGIVRYLAEARFDGLVSDLMVLRALFPDRAATLDATAGLRGHAEVVNELVDRLFIKLRMPGAALEPDDVESAAYRSSLRALVDVLRSQDDGEPPAGAGLRLVGFVDREELDAAAGALEREPLVTPTPWRTTAELLGTSLQRDGVVLADLTAYRDALLRAFGQLRGLGPDELAAALRQPNDELAAERANLLRALEDERSVSA